MNRLTASSALVVALVLALPASASAATDGATIDKTGWWNRANSSTPTPAAPVTVPPPPGVPEGDLTAGRLGDEPTAIAAVGIQPDDGPGATVESFTLTLREDPDARANQATDQAAILACPITSFWAGGENGTWDTAPEHDCEAASVAGERAEDGTWTFDLAPIGELWFDPAGTIRADGVALVPDLESEARSFRVVWSGGDDIDVVLQTTPADDAGGDPFDLPPSAPPGDIGSGGGSTGGGASIFSPPQITSPPTISPADPVDVDADGDGVAPTEPARDVVGNWPVAGFVLVPLVLAVLAAMSYWLGPAGQPSTVDRRGGVSRALAATRPLAPQER